MGTIKLMTSDHALASQSRPPGGGVLGASGYNFGLGFAVRPTEGLRLPVRRVTTTRAVERLGPHRLLGRLNEQLVAVFMAQQLGTLRLYHRALIRQLICQAIAD